MVRNELHKAFYDKLTRYETVELLNRYNVERKTNFSSNHTLIDTCHKEVLRIGSNDDLLYILVPADEFGNIPLNEFHQIIKDLTVGIYCFSQVPQLSLENNVDMSSECNISPAYRKTRVAEILTEVDYMVKAVWHGSFFPKDKRLKFSDTWKKKLDMDENGQIQTKRDIFCEFEAGGMVDIHKDLEDCEKFRILNEPLSDEAKDIFIKYKDSYLMKLFFRVSRLEKYKNIFMFESVWDIESIITADTELMTKEEIHIITSCLQQHQSIIKDTLMSQDQTNYNVHLIKFIAFAVDLLISLKKISRIPKLDALQSLLPGSIQDEAEIPPLISEKEFCDFPKKEIKKVHLLGGISFEIDCQQCVVDSPVLSSLGVTEDTCSPSHLKIINVGNNPYYLIPFATETFKSQPTKTPKWFGEFMDTTQRMSWTNTKQSESQVHEYFKQHYGSKGANIRKNPHEGLRSACYRGSTSILNTLIGDISMSFLNTKDKNGYTLIHYAVLNDQPSVFLSIANFGGDINNSCGFNSKRHLFTIHLAARVGALSIFQIMISSSPHLLKCADSDGWLPIHYASAYNHPAIIRVIGLRRGQQLNNAKNILLQSPIHVAAKYGALDSIKHLLASGVDFTERDSNQATITRLATLSLHPAVLKYLIENKMEGINVWSELGEMILEEDARKKALTCLEILCDKISNAGLSMLHSGCLVNLKTLLETDGRDDAEELLISSIVNKISRKAEIGAELTQPTFLDYFASLLLFENDKIISNVTDTLSNVLQYGDKESIDLGKFVSPLLGLLTRKCDDVLIKSLNAIGFLSKNNSSIQVQFIERGISYRYLQFLERGSTDLRIAVCDSTCFLCYENEIAQQEFVTRDFITILKKMININCVNLKTASSRAIRSTAIKNTRIQKLYIECGFLEDVTNLFQVIGPQSELKVFKFVRENGGHRMFGGIARKRCYATENGGGSPGNIPDHRALVERGKSQNIWFLSGAEELRVQKYNSPDHGVFLLAEEDMRVRSFECSSDDDEFQSIPQG